MLFIGDKDTTSRKLRTESRHNKRYTPQKEKTTIVLKLTKDESPCLRNTAEETNGGSLLRNAWKESTCNKI